MTGFVDLQVNGFAGVDFNDPKITSDQIHKVARYLRDTGTDRILATVITAFPERMERCLQNLVRAMDSDPVTNEIIAGFHLEGPFISAQAGYVGAHPPEAVRVADRDLTMRLMEAGAGRVRLITLAPESDPGGRVTQLLVEQGILVAAGHTDASLDELHVCIDRGLTLFTHLGNGCPMMMHRHDNIIQRALSFHRQLHYGLIADGVHLPIYMLRNIVELAGISQCFVVTDAIAAAGLGPGRYTLGYRSVEVDESRTVWSSDRSCFVGSAATMSWCAQILEKAGFQEKEISALVRENPGAHLR